MSSCNREFLLPYLLNLCALHLVEEGIEGEIAAWEREKRNLNQDNLPQPPEKPEYQKLDDGRHIARCLLCAIVTLAVVCWIILRARRLGEINWDSILMICGMWAALAAMWFSALKKEHRAAQINESLEREYHQRMLEYDSLLEIAEASLQAELDYAERRIMEWELEKGVVQKLLRDAYGADVIPDPFRGLYHAVYLYDWFSTTQSDDLDDALRVYTPEESKKRLEAIIADQAEEILDLRMKLAHENPPSEGLLTKLLQLGKAPEERLREIQMMESNAAATAYFLSAEYVRDLCR
ncbi:MAG: hypothetical protein IJ960_03065 [Oscillospiraceae bacterium]|nr:hypothetical protein [Oscillospiraceae bacterium]